MNETNVSSRSDFGASQAAIRRWNLALALQAIWNSGSISRTALARRLDLSKVAVGRLVGELLAMGYVCEHAEAPTGQRGRPPTMIVLRAGRHYSLGLDLRVDRLAVQARDLAGNVLLDEQFPVARSLGVNAVIGSLADHARRIAQSVGFAPSGIGVALPARFSDDGEVVLSSTYFDWRDVPFAAQLAAALGPKYPRPVVTHIAGAAAIANWRELGADDVGELLHLQIGVGAGIGFGSQLANNRSLSFGNIAHLPLDPNGPRCPCGARGCLDAVVGFDALASRAIHCGLSLGSGSSAMRDLCTALAARRADGSPEAAALIDDIARWSGRAAAIFLTLLRPNRFTIAGYPLFLGESYWPAFFSALEPHVPNARSIFARTRLGDDASVVGALLLGAHTALANPTYAH